MNTNSSPILSNDVFNDRQAALIYRETRFNFTWLARGAWRHIDFKTATDDRDERGLHAEAAYSPSATETTTFIVNHFRSHYIYRSRTDTDILVGMRFSYRIDRQASVGVEGQHVNRLSTDELGAYRDTTVQLTFTYSSGAIQL